MAKRALKLTGVVLLALILLLAGGGYLVFLSVSGQGSGAIERWIGGQVVGVANGYLNPQLSFKNLDYQYPRTLVLHDVDLTADPATADVAPDTPTIADTPAAAPDPQDAPPPSPEDIANTPADATPPDIDPDALAGGGSADQPGGALNNPAIDPDAPAVGENPAPAPGPRSIAHIKKLTIELAEVPSVGQPLKIKKLILEKPVIRLIAPDPAAPFKLLGFSHLLKEQPQTPEADGKPVKLSEMFQIRLVRLKNAGIAYDVQGDDAQAMVLNQINTELDIVPEADENGTVWHTIQTSLKRDPVFSLDLRGRVNLDDMVAQIGKLNLQTRLGREYDGVLPPQISSLLRKHEVTGMMQLSAKGTVNAMAPLTSDLRAQLRMRNVNAAYDKYRLPVKSIDLAARAHDGLADIQTMKIQALGGQITGDGQARYQEPGMPASLTVLAKGVKLEQAVRAGESDADRAAGNTSSLAGTVDAQVSFRAPIQQALTKAAGHGVVDLQDGQLARVPIISDLRAAIGKVTSLAGQRVSRAIGKDSAHVEFDLAGDKAHFTDIRVTSTVFAVKGAGDIYFNQDLDLLVSAGPLERLTGSLGPLGLVVDNISANVAQYSVTGTINQPRIGLRVGGGVGGKAYKILTGG